MYKEILLFGSLALSFQGVCSTQISDLVNPSGDMSPTTQKIFGVPTPKSTEVVDLNRSDLPLPLVRERPKLILTYDQATEDNYKTDYGGDLVAALHRAMTSVNQVFVSSGSDVQFDWLVIKSDTEFQQVPFFFDQKALAEQEWYQDFKLGNLADAVIGIVRSDFIGGGQCVKAYWHSQYDTDGSPRFERFFPCVVDINSLTGTVLPHELGHWLGADHDRYQFNKFDDSKAVDYWPGYGYVDLDNGFMSIMSVFSECEDSNVECTKLPLFSNPYLLHNGAPIGKDSSNIDAADNVTLFSRSNKELLADRTIATNISTEISTDKVHLTWGDVSSRYLVQVSDGFRPHHYNVIESYIVTEPEITLDRPFFELSGTVGNNFKQYVVVKTINAINDDVGSISVGEVALRGRYEDFDMQTGETLIQDGQIGLSSSLVSMPEKGQSISINLTVMDENIANNDFYLASNAAPCLTTDDDCRYPINRDVLDVHLGFGNDPLYGDLDPEWLNKIFDFSFSGEGKLRTLTLTSKWSQDDWKSYFSSLIKKEAHGETEHTSFNFNEAYFIKKKLPLVILRGGEDSSSKSNNSLAIIGEAMLDIDLSGLFDPNLEIDSQGASFSKMGFRQHIPSQAAPEMAPAFYSSSQLTYASTTSVDEDATSETAVLSKALSGTIVKIDVYGPEFDNFKLDSTIPWSRINRNTFALELTDVETGVHTINIITATASATSTAGKVIGSGEIIVADALPELFDTNDTDNDGLSDAVEGFKDTDSDGIVDYIDPLSSANNTLKGLDNLPIYEAYQEGQLFSVARTLSIPQKILQAKQGVTDSAVMTWDQLQSIYPNQSIDEQGYTPYSDVIGVNYHSNLGPRSDWMAELVVTLPEDKPIKENSEYRVIDSQGQWSAFSDGMVGPNVFSGLAVDGSCSVNIDDYSVGLIPGKNCLLLTYVSINPDVPMNVIEFGPGALMVKNAPEVINHAPTVSTSSIDATYREGSVFTISSEAIDPDGDALTYQWSQLSGTGITFSSANSAAVTFEVPEVSGDETIELKLVVSDGELEASIIIAFMAIDVPINHAPTVSIGALAGSYDEGTKVTLSADAVDQDGDTLTYLWTQLSGTGVNLSSANSATVSFMVPEVSSDEIIELQLVVSDGELEAKSIVSFKAINIPTAVTPPDTNKPEDNSSGGGSMGWLVLFAGVIYAGRSNKRKLAA
ncbi:hypothetical protein EKG38_10720 [Shewanella canadensis]|uniref:GlyGly-CTERM sorting domain-containing protein n=1 Tax=Shewanella canadensis TaxID=271096 RepID=A0A431WTT2_9GAMM|nr:hypothetical protein [Shewanella canadensis]RTR38645.1 hypothetical protein EKG38_10720 [Shewanella canadensis]